MKKRPRSITGIGWIFIAVGVIALVYHLLHPSEDALIWICFVRLLAIVCGVFLLSGFNWARWLLLLWLAYHVALGKLSLAICSGRAQFAVGRNRLFPFSPAGLGIFSRHENKALTDTKYE